MRTKPRQSGWPAAVIVAAILTVPVLSHETGYVPDRAASVDGLGAASVAAAATPGASRRSMVPEVWPSPRATRDPEPVRQAVPERTHEPTSARTSRGARLGGQATWYCGPNSRCTRGYPSGFYAAIRRDLLGHRGDQARVCHEGRCVVVTIIDCNCGANANLVDLYSTPFSRLAPLSLGRIDVTLEWLS